MINIDLTKDSRSGGCCSNNNNSNISNNSCGENRKPVANNSEGIKFNSCSSSNNSQKGRKSTVSQLAREKKSQCFCDNLSIKKQQQIQPTNIDICSEKLPSSSSDDNDDDDETEDWQLLELDEHMIKEEKGMSNMEQKDINNDNGNSIGYVNGNREENNYADAYGQNGLTKSDKVKRYLDVDPVEPRKSPALVYLCTAIYAILPAASILALCTLIGLLFTRFYFITIIYFAYILWDRNTCNRGKFFNDASKF